MKITYIPSKDELILKIYPVRRKPNKQLGQFKLWWDDKGNICAIAITNYINELEEFKRNQNIIQLKGIWRGIKITEEDILKTRKELLSKIEEDW
jgi:hypothetical protein